MVVFAVGYMGWAQWQSMQTSESAAASDLYEALGTTVVLGPGVELTEASVASARQLIAELKEEHGDSVYALYGALFGARLAVDDRDLDTAEQELQWLLDNARTGYFSPTDESLLITARLRLARVILSKGEAQRALDLLTALDVQHRAKAMPSQLSGGEQQRVAIARGLVNHPPVILADEPTAPLDSERAMAVIRILNDMAKKYETAIIVVTHDEKIIPTFKRIYHIRDGVTHEEAGEGRGFQ